MWSLKKFHGGFKGKSPTWSRGAFSDTVSARPEPGCDRMEMQERETNASAVACQGLPPDPGLNSVGAGGPGSAAGHPCSHGWPRVSCLVCAGRENAADDGDTFARTVLAAQPEASQMTPPGEVQEGTCVLPNRSQPRSPGRQATSDDSDELNRPQLLQAHKIPIAGIRSPHEARKGGVAHFCGDLRRTRAQSGMVDREPAARMGTPARVRPRSA